MQQENSVRTIYVLLTVLALGVVLLGASPVYASMQGDVDQAATIIERFQAVPEKAIPQAVLKDAKGLGIMTVIKAGFGFQIGAEVTEFVFILNTDAAVQAFSRDVNVSLGGDISVAAGPIGRNAEAGITPLAAVYTYSRSQGLFAGVSLEGTVIGTRNDANAEYYGRRVTTEEILSGKVPPPSGAMRLVQVLTRQVFAKR